MLNPQIKLMLTIEKQSSRTMAKAFTFIVILCASLISIVYAQAACNPPVTALPILLVKWSKGSSHISSALVVSPAATESAGFYMSTQQIAELVVEFALSKTSPAAVDNAPAFQALLRAVGHVAMPALDLMMNAVVEYALLAIQLLIAEPVAMLWVDHKPPAKLPAVTVPLFAIPMMDAALESVPL
ncbi:hypothetical protein KXV68_002344 [Aspergillus fumigatus]|nr:hypothetical protein CNMCM8686_002883 [Aspergillus fumigatus]KAH1336383.1 hypothetical protein KXX67_003021 [Aspergillus fumigatus]KAH1452086.1 hypothetical protein KXX13_003012 [Aspergillus fumigatus]KAH1897642.1 hypothetical protein KXW69_001915 [Aspergillus fumigatus]KAH2114988.1 hypothetical protein KXW75_005207 [Aspergillus fumigatus]